MRSFLLALFVGSFPSPDALCLSPLRIFTSSRYRYLNSRTLPTVPNYPIAMPEHSKLPDVSESEHRPCGCRPSHIPSVDSTTSWVAQYNPDNILAAIQARPFHESIQHVHARLQILATEVNGLVEIIGKGPE
ncbi:hypothetical protein QBC44DRAFT_385670 [Cladorrhinum sp. PSN332]|nr:hypothetical protein QBC44DRAFT_385670 [Cladorrhinum sp. PSN332]